MVSDADSDSKSTNNSKSLSALYPGSALGMQEPTQECTIVECTSSYFDATITSTMNTGNVVKGEKIHTFISARSKHRSK